MKTLDAMTLGRPAEDYRQIVEVIPHLVWVADADGNLEYANARCREFVGLPLGDLLGWDWRRVVHPDDWPRALDQWRRALATGEPHRVEFRLRRADGEYRWHDVRGEPLRDQDGVVARWFGTCTDVHEQKRAAETLRASESRLRAIIEKSFDAVAVLDAEGVVRYASPSTQALLGYPLGEFVGRSAFQYVHPDDLPLQAERMRHLLHEPGSIVAGCNRYRHASGEWRWLETRTTSLLDDPDVRGLVVNFRDVTESRAAQRALEQSEARFRAIIENSYDAVELLAADGSVLYATPAIARIGGRTPEEVVGQNTFQWIPPEEQAGLGEQFAAFLATPGAFQASECRFLHKDGSWRWAESRATNLLHDPSVRAVVLNLRDVTEQHAARESLALLAAVVESSEEAIASISLDGTVLSWNPAAERLFGYTAAEIIGRPVFDLAPPDNLAEARRYVERVRGGERVPAYETERIDKAGTRIPVSVSLSAIRRPDGAVTGLAAVCRDLTEWRRLEEQYRQAQKMEAVGRLAGGVAHDFNNLLTVINGFSDLVIDALPPGNANREFVREVRRAGERAAGLTRQLLAFSRRQVLRPQVLDLNAVVTNLGKMLGRLLGEDVVLETDLRRGVGPILADPGQIEQVLLNLSVNARDAMPTGGRLAIRTADAEVAADHAPPGIEPGPFVVLTVSDTGTGMTDEVRAHIFEPFFTTKEVGQGTGLGLATVHGIVEQSGGFVEVESRPGEGAAFRVYLPRAAQGGGAVAAPAESAAGRGTETVLLVEDEPAVRALAGRVLRQSGYTVLEAEGSREAVAAVRRHTGRVHLLVTDVVMPGQGGRSLAEQLRAADPKLKVLFMSGYTDDAIMHHGIRADRVHFLQKPFSPVALAATVREILDAPDDVPG